jgi:hypothetical protein
VSNFQSPNPIVSGFSKFVDIFFNILNKWSLELRSQKEFLTPINHKLNQLENPTQTKDELINNSLRGR